MKIKLLLAMLLAGFANLLWAQDQTPDSSGLNWPRTCTGNGFNFAIYQPQISAWPSNQLQGRAVVGVQSGNGSPTFGVAYFQARTEVDKMDRLVTLENIEITGVKFPTQTNMQDQYLAALKSCQQQTMRVIPLDHLEAVFAASVDITRAKLQTVKNDPPKIFYATQPSILVQVDGLPVLKPLTGNYLRVVNTRAVLLVNDNAGSVTYYLYAGNNWYSASAIEGSWALNPTPPLDIDTALGAALATKRVDLLNTELPAPLNICVSVTPAELIQTTGPANLLSVAGTSLLYAANTSSALFYYLNDANYYVLVSGRWFKAPALTGPWTFVPGKQLPADFKSIPPTSEKAAALASVPGTPQAQETVIANSIPQTATVQRNQASLTVNYAGNPGFAPVSGTSMSYATNSDTPVVMVNTGSYYACQAGVWFTAASPSGPWMVASSVPPVIYTIPVDCPIYYVTYCYTYGSTADTVYVGYAPGYTGTVVSGDGTVVYGTGYYYPASVVGSTWYSWPVTYGYGAAISVCSSSGYAYGFTAAGCVAPYWGCYHYGAPAGYSYARVNVNGTSCYSYYGSAVVRRAYNPNTGATGYSAKAAAYDPYTGNYAAGRQAAGYNPATGTYGAAGRGLTGNAYSGEASGYDRGVVGNTQSGNKAVWNNGTMYADDNGSVYRYNSSSGAEQYNNGNWQPASRSATANVSRYDSAQNAGAQRYDNYRREGGSGWRR